MVPLYKTWLIQPHSDQWVHTDLRKGQCKIKDSEVTAKDSAVYLGAAMTACGGATEAVKERLTKAKKACHSLSIHVWRSRALTQALKFRLFAALVLIILYYELCCFTIQPTSERKLERWQTKYLGILHGARSTSRGSPTRRCEQDAMKSRRAQS